MIVDEYISQPDKPLIVQTTNGQVYIQKDFSLERKVPCEPFIRIKSGDDIYWFNVDNVIWIGPRP